jgi:hypothetical protein
MSSSFVPEEEYVKRFSLCKACERFDLDSGACQECFCYMESKCRVKYSKCPIGKW